MFWNLKNKKKNFATNYVALTFGEHFENVDQVREENKYFKGFFRTRKGLGLEVGD